MVGSGDSDEPPFLREFPFNCIFLRNPRLIDTIIIVVISLKVEVIVWVLRKRSFLLKAVASFVQRLSLSVDSDLV